MNETYRLIFSALSILHDFFEAGGVLLLVLFAVCTVFAGLWISKIFYLFREARKDTKDMILQLQFALEKARSPESYYKSFYENRIKKKLSKGINQLRILLVLCPLFGLLGTVTGMIRVFDTLSNAGSGNARQMASGISMATLPTMVGMAAAIVGLMALTLLEEGIGRHFQVFRDMESISSRERSKK